MSDTKQNDLFKHGTVLVLDHDNFTKVHDEHHIMFINFYKKSWKKYYQFEPTFKKIAKLMKNHFPEVIVGEVNIDKEHQLADRYNVKEEYNLKLIVNHTFQYFEQEYKGDLFEDIIISWLEKATSEVSQEINSKYELKRLKRDHDVLIFYFGQQETDPQFIAFQQAAIMLHDIKFAHTFNAELIQKTQAKMFSIAMYNNQEGKKRIDFNEDLITSYTIKDFVEKNLITTILQCNEVNRRKIFDPFTPTMFLFVNESSDQTKELEYAFKIVAKKFKGRMLYMLLKQSENPDCYQQTAEFLSVYQNQLPTARIIDIIKGDLSFYRLEGELSKKTMQTFLMKFRSNQLQPYVRTEPIPDKAEQESRIIKKLVADNYIEEVMNSNQDVVVIFSRSDHCQDCEKLIEKYQKIAQLNQNKNIKFMSMDVNKNEYIKFVNKGLLIPTILVYKTGQKNNPITIRLYDNDDALTSLFPYKLRLSENDEL